MMRGSLLLILMISLIPSISFGWGRVGHYIVAEIAERELSPSALLEIKELTGDQPLAALANWADDIKSDKSFDQARPWHYINVPDGKDFLEVERNTGGDLLTALPMFENQIADKNLAKEKRVEALKFYIHLMGDLGQPMHLGRKEDRGGNDVKLKWFDKETNLHAIWDEDMVEYEKLSYTEYANFLTPIDTAKKTEWIKGNYLDWARENVPARNAIYAHQEKEYKWEYYYSMKSILYGSLTKAGVRLGAKLNGLFGLKTKEADAKDRPTKKRKKRK